MTIRKIGVFDSGSGGLFVTGRLRKLMPHCVFQLSIDSEHAPYGGRPKDEIIELTDKAIQPLLKNDVIVLACNTATTNAISTLRKKYPKTTFVGFEPMIKIAAERSRTRHITLLATHATSTSERAHQLIDCYAKDCTVDIPDTTGWARNIDDGNIDIISLEEVEKSVSKGSDSIILGCTHYIALYKKMEEKFPTINIYEPTPYVAKQIERALDAKK